MNYIISLLELTKFYIIFRYGLNIPVRKNIFIITYVIISTTLYSFFKTALESSTETFPLYPVWIASILLLLFELSFLKTAFTILISTCVVSIFDTFIVFCIYVILRYNSNENLLFPIHNIYDIQIIYIISYSISLILISVFIFFKRNTENVLRNIKVRYYAIISFVVLINTWIVFTLWSDSFQVLLLVDNISYFIYVVLGILITTIMQIYFILKLAIANNIQQEKNNLNTHYLGLLNEHYKYINKLDSDTRKFRHDIKNHILIIKKLLNQNSLDELNKYTSEVFGKLENMTANIYTNNPVIDAIINQYAYMCKNHDISLSVSGFLPDTCHIEAFDLCTIFSNILQNAYEAAQKVSFSDRFITITIRYDNDIIILHQENSFLNENTSLHKKTGLPITTKEDSENHGFGLSNINDCLKKNRGTMSIKISEKIFIMDILIFNY